MTCHRHFVTGNISELATHVEQTCKQNHLNLIILPYLDAESNFEEFSQSASDQSLEKLFRTSTSDVCLIIDHGATALTDKMNILLVYDTDCINSRVAFRYIWKFIRAPSVLLTVLRRTSAIPLEEVPSFENSRHSLSNFKKEQDNIFTSLPSPSVLAPKNGDMITKVENLIQQNCTEDALFDTLQAISDSEEYLSYYLLPENMMKEEFFQTDLFSFTLVVSGRSDRGVERIEDPLANLIGENAVKILASGIGCGQLVFSAKVSSISEEKTPRLDGDLNI